MLFAARQTVSRLTSQASYYTAPAGAVKGFVVFLT
jgi:hypothetical protein